jgi:pimeloyl-ACP methyl ester carboxylesterase
VAEARGTPPVPVLSWTDCGGNLQCATARVPLDYDHPHRDSISLAVIRRPAGDPAHRVGSLVFNPGGPGTSGLEFVRKALAFVPPELLARFDFVSFDPRGVGESTPVRCFASVAEQQAFFSSVPPFPVGASEEQALIDAYRDADRRCLKRNARLLPHVSTANVARDMDLLRQALGESSLTYLGASYGTYLGATYANLFPDRVRALALDGAVDPVADATGRDGEADRIPTFTRMMSHVGASETLAQFLRLCADAGPSRCPFAVGTDRQATTGRFDALMARLREHALPVVTPQGTVQLTYPRVVAAVGGTLYSQAAFPTLALALQQLDQGDGTLMARLGQLLTPPTSYDNSHEAGAAVICADSDNPESPLDWPPAAHAADRRAPYFGSPFAYSSFACADWKVRDRDRFVGPFNRPTANPSWWWGPPSTPRLPTSEPWP